MVLGPAQHVFDVVIVGVGHAGAQVAVGLRQRSFAGSIAVVGDERQLPYGRPPLTKEYLFGEKTVDRITIRPAFFWKERDVVISTSRRVTAADAAGHAVLCANGARIGYGQVRALVLSRATIAPERLAGTHIALKDLH